MGKQKQKMFSKCFPYGLAMRRIITRSKILPNLVVMLGIMLATEASWKRHKQLKRALSKRN
jgi:hypothetical protein